MLSKMAKPEPRTYREIAKIDLTNSKLPELKQYARDLSIKVSGNKSDIKTRIETHIKSILSAIKIQKVFRRHLVFHWMRLKGTRENCVNDTDFYTLEPLAEIPYMYFIKYEDTAHNVNYGFDLKSLCTLAAKNSKFENPYNRENMKVPFGMKMIKVVKLTNILFPGNELIPRINESSIHQQQMPQQISLQQRTINLFIYIDNLGNYTNPVWLTDLNEGRLYYMVSCINRLWHRLTSSLRYRICPGVSPFSQDIFGNNPVVINREMVVKMAEILVHSGVDDEHKKLGAMYFLSGLTLVSLDARTQLPWLYESYFNIVN